MTAIGDVLQSGHAIRSVCLLTGLIATNSPPAAATAGVPCFRDENSPMNKDYGVCYTGRASRECVLSITSSAGSGTMTGTFRLWGFVSALNGGTWVPVGTGGDTTKGIINAGNAIGETSADKIVHAEPVYLAGMFSRLYLECTVIGGTSTAFEAWITSTRLPAV